MLIGFWTFVCSLIIIGSPWYPPRWLDRATQAGIPAGMILFVTALVLSVTLLL